MDFDALISFYPTQDLARSRVFYEDIVGLELARDQKTCLIFKVSTSGYIGFCQHVTVPDYHAGLIITLMTDRVDEVYAALQTEGAELEAPPKLNQTYGIYHFFACDPNGYRLEVQRFLDPLV